MRTLGGVIVLGVLALVASPAPAQPRVRIDGVTHTPLNMCVPGTIEFIHHTRKSLKLEPQRYCTDDDWKVDRVEHDGSRVYWTVSFAAAKPGEPDPYGPGDVICLCRKR